MQGANKERWKVLCEQAAVEQDPAKLHELIKEINDLLEAKEARLKGNPVLRQNSIRTENSAIPCRNRCPIGVIPSSPERQDSLPGEPPRGVPVYIKDEGTRTFFATLRWFGLGSPIVPVV